MKRFSMLLIALVCCTLGAFAQKKISLRLLDEQTGEVVSFATVSITPEGATKATKYVLSDHEGNATLEGVRKGAYTLKCELLGYKTLTKALKVENSDLRLGDVKLSIDSKTLDAASVSAVGNPIIVKKDTVEYNASSFRTTDNDVLEDLLKKLPGVEVGSDGSITANGKTISKITIDGKTFFMDDPSIASKNLPAKIVEKVKVLEKKSEQAQFTGIDDGEEETVIDLSLKPGMFNGWFGNVMGGGGADTQKNAATGKVDGRWQGAAMVGRFTQKSQISVILNGNNTNNRGFNDLAGNMMSAMSGGRMGGGGGPMWGTGNGITTSWLGGVNGAFTLCDGRMDLNGMGMYSGTNKDVLENSYKETYLDDGSTLIYDKDGANNTFSDGARFGIRLDHKFSDKTSILFEPQFSFGCGHYNQMSNDLTLTQIGEQIDSTNKGFTGNTGNNRNWTANGRLLFRQRLGKPGRTVSANIDYNFSHNTLNGFNQSISRLFNQVDNSWEGTPTNQRYENVSNSYSMGLRASYTEPLTEKLFLEATYSYNWRKNVSDKNTWDSGIIDNFNPEGTLEYQRAAETLNSTYSNNITNESQTHRAGVNLQYQTKSLRLQIGAQYQPTITDNDTPGWDHYHSVTHNWAPQAMIDWDINDDADFRLMYRGRSSQPSTSQLMPVPDNSNPLSLSFGNPSLNPYFSHSFRGMTGYTNKQSFFSIRAFFNGGIVQDGITNASWFDKAGVSYSLPLNGDVTGNVGLGCFLNAPIAKSNFSISNMFNISYNNSKSYVGRTDRVEELSTYYNRETSQFDYPGFERNITGGDFSKYFITNSTDNLNFSENLRATYRNDYLEVILGARTNMNKPWYSKEMNVKKAPTWNNNASASVQWTAKFGFTLKTDLNYNWYNGYTTPQKDEWIWNAQISQLLFKNKVTLALNAYDILGQAKNLFVTDSANYHMETRNNTLGRYIILSLTYRFGNFAKAGQQMGMGHGPGPGHGPRPH